MCFFFFSPTMNLRFSAAVSHFFVVVVMQRIHVRFLSCTSLRFSLRSLAFFFFFFFLHPFPHDFQKKAYSESGVQFVCFSPPSLLPGPVLGLFNHKVHTYFCCQRQGAMTASAATSSPSTSKADYCLQSAQAAKAAGNAALQDNNLRGASFEYKKVYLFLAEYLPQEVTGPSTQPSATRSGGSGGSGDVDSSSTGLVQMLQQHRRPTAASSSALSSSSSSQVSAAQQQEMLQLYAITLNNLALVHLKLGRYHEGVTCATAVLEQPKLRAALDSTQTRTRGADSHAVAPLISATPAGKALLRRASCYVKLGEWAAAAADVQALMDAHAAAHEAADPACVQLAEAIQRGRAADTAREKKMMQRMFA